MSILWRKGEFCLNAQRKLGKEASLPKLFITGSFRTNLTRSFYLRRNEDLLCPEPDKF